MKKAKRTIFVLLLCAGLSAAMFTGCGLKGSDSRNMELADRFLSEFFSFTSLMQLVSARETSGQFPHWIFRILPRLIPTASMRSYAPAKK